MSMDVYGGQYLDDLLNFPADDFSSSSSSSAFHHPSSAPNQSSIPPHDLSDIINSVPNDDVAELEWVSTYMEDSFTDFPPNEKLAPTVNFESPEFRGRGRSKRGGESSEVGRRCTHCASEKTPQWRTGPLGPKTLCNACGVRYKSGRLVPEYRPAASPTFMLTQHSNSHRKVLELRRQKEEMQRQQQQQQEAYFSLR